MEENRLTKMVEGYDKDLFDQIYKDTSALRKKLTYQIDAKRFGVDADEIHSWFDVKFIFAFNKYYESKTPELLKAHIISSLMFFKQRILRFSYSQKAQVHNTISLEDYAAHNPDVILVDFEYAESQVLLNEAKRVMNNLLSPTAYKIFNIELNPPLWIIDQLSEQNKTTATKIPSSLIAEYLGWSNTEDSTKKVNQLRKEIREAIEHTKEHFSHLADKI